MSKPKCPVCGRPGAQAGPDTYRCALGHFFDTTPDEGSSVFNDPTKRIEREDEIRVARGVNLERRSTARQGFRFGGRR